MRTRVNPELARKALNYKNNDYANRVARAYNNSAKCDDCLFGGTLAKSEPHKAVGIVSKPITAVACSMMYLQVFNGAEAPVWVATNSGRLTEKHLLAVEGRDCYFYPTASQYSQWFDCVGMYREILGSVAYVHDGLFLAHEFCPEVIKEDSDLLSIVTLPFETSSLFMGFDDLLFYKQMGACLLKTGDLQR